MRLRTLNEDLTGEQASAARRLSAYVYKMLKGAADARELLRRRGSEPPGDFIIDYLRHSWLPNDGRNRFALPAAIMPTINGEIIPAMVVISTDNGTSFVRYYSTGPGHKPYAEIRIDVAVLENAKTLRQTSLAIQEIMARVTHEPVHLYNSPQLKQHNFATPVPANAPRPVSPLGAAKEQLRQAQQSGDAVAIRAAAARTKMQRALYLTQPHEVEAYGRQFANIYHRQFPNAPYDTTKILGLINDVLKRFNDAGINTINNHAMSYFRDFLRPPYGNYRDATGRYPFRQASVNLVKTIAATVNELLRAA